METRINVIENVKLKKPVLVEGLPGIGNVGRVAAGYLVSELKPKKFAELYSPHFLPLVVIHDNSLTHLLKCEFYYYKGKQNDLIILTGDTQSISPEGHYEICDKIIEFAKKLGVKEVITLGGFVQSTEIKEPRVIGAATNKDLIKKYEKFGIDFGKQHNIGTIVGATGLLLGLGNVYGIEGLCLMGETYDMPLFTDPKAADKILVVLKKIFNLKIDLSKLENTINEMESKMKKTETVYKKMIHQMPQKDDQIRYIG